MMSAADEGRDTTPDDEVAAAAQEAGAIGGRAPEGEDPAQRPLDEAGQGESEGFEQAEEALIDQATHGGPGTTPGQDAFAVEEDGAQTEAGEADSETPQDL